LRVGDYSGAALSISDLVGSQQHNINSAHRLLALDKLAAWGASTSWPSEVPQDMAAAAADADNKLRLLKLQVGALARFMRLHAHLVQTARGTYMCRPPLHVLHTFWARLCTAGFLARMACPVNLCTHG
jgi:hypothetical protein